MSRIPPEIWWKVFEYLIVPKHFLETVYEDNNWIVDAKEMEQMGPHRQMKEAKALVVTISLVCKTWKSFADSFSICLQEFGLEYSDNPTPETISKAQRVHILSLDAILPHIEEREVEWKAIGIRQEHAKQLEGVKRPNLRRLELHYSGDKNRDYQTDPFIESLKLFTNITWLRYYTGTIIFQACNEDDGGERITLPDLQVLHYQGVGAFHLPYYRLNLPSLRHLYIFAHGFANSRYIPLSSIITSYGSTLRSLYLEISSGGQLGIPDDPSFPDWTKVPHLEELAVDAPVLLKFHPLPSTHPLRVFAAQVWRIDNLLSWLDSDNLKVIRFLHALKKPDGSLGTQHQDFARWTGDKMRELSAADMEALEEKAKLKGIILQACWEPNGSR
ncbi:hypothetical protein FRC20_003397 [Serendipita sp. 405]|nr:hypothetical protein FRC15_003524 [Serendipita sp. 397]KAG8844758.1 hypothetical protein FRC20_003397 [Serendipita sp. 405]